MDQPRPEGRRARIALKPIETVVVGTSLLEGSDVVVGAALDVARAVKGRLNIVHSLPLDALVPRFGTGWAESDFYRKWSEMQRAELISQIERLDITVAMESRVESGTPHRVILDNADRLGAELIVIGASERGRFAKVLGGTADRILRQAKCPVLVVRGDWRFPIERVLAPVDFSLLSGDALECGLGFLLQIGVPAPKVELFFAVSELLLSLSEPFSSDQLEKFATQELTRFGREAAGTCSAQLSSRIAVGRPADEILQAAEQFQSDLVVLGTHGQGGVERALLGSVARVVATEAGCAVLFIPPEIALGASVAEAVIEQTEPRWREPSAENVKTADKGGVS
ncbi:MAG: universal stress protein [bacterium]|nr:universal stress protein [bacterium]